MEVRGSAISERAHTLLPWADPVCGADSRKAPGIG